MRLSQRMVRAGKLAVAALIAFGPAHWMFAQQDARAIVQRAVDSELKANHDDHSIWRYMQREDGGEIFFVVDTHAGSIKRHVEEHGKPASPDTLAADDAYNERFVRDPGLQAKQKRDGAHDDKSAEELLRQMPDAFVWKIDSDNDKETALSYSPNPNFNPPDMQSRVMSAMTGTMIVDKSGDRIRSFKGHLVNEVNIGFGLLARIRSGGTFDIERRPIGNGNWQITETHVHISGHALFFKTIGQQQDEVKYDFTPVPPATTLEQAVVMLKEPPKESAHK